MKSLIKVPLKGLCYLIHILSDTLKSGLASFLGFIWFDLLRIRRQSAIENVERAFPNLVRREAVAMARKSLYHMSLTLVDFCSFPFLKGEDFDKMFELDGLEFLDQALAEEKGVFAMSLHLGNGDIGAAALAHFDYKVHIISKVFKTQWLNDMWFGSRRRMGVRFIAPRKSSYEILKAIKAKEIVIFVLDQYTGPPNGIKTQFFGHDTGTAVGLALFAQRSGAPVLPVYTYRKGPNQHVIKVEPAIPFIEGDSKEESLRLTTQAYNDVIERIVRQHPEQWMWIHRRWKVGFA